MPKAVRFAEYGDIDVLQVVEVARPKPGPGEVLHPGEGGRHQPRRGTGVSLRRPRVLGHRRRCVDTCPDPLIGALRRLRR